MSLFLTEKIKIEPLNIDCENQNQIVDDSIMVDVEGLHAITTGNYTRYLPSALERSVKSWTFPYNKPVIMHHNEDDGKIIGRIHAVQYKTVNTRSGTPALSFTINVPDEDGKQQIKDGRLSTVSVGINATDVKCSICGHNVARNGMCEHKRGRSYSGNICYWDVYEFIGKELSYVITPSDPYAHNIKIYSPTINMKENSKMILNESMTEGTTIDNNIVDDNSNNSLEDTSTTPVVEETTPVIDAVPATPDTQLTESQDEGVEGETSALEGETTATDPVNPEVTENGTDGQSITESMLTVDNNSPENSVLYSRLLNMTRELSEAQSSIREANSQRLYIEEQLYTLTLKYKTILAEQLNSKRLVLGKSAIDKDTLLKRTYESLEDAIIDCDTELQSASTPIKESEAVDDTVIDDGVTIDANQEDNTTQTITESLDPVSSPISILDDDQDKQKNKTKETGTINLKESLNNISSILFSK